MISSRKADNGDPSREIFGVDFSGAADAGQKIWIARKGGKVTFSETIPWITPRYAYAIASIHIVIEGITS